MKDQLEAGGAQDFGFASRDVSDSRMLPTSFFHSRSFSASDVIDVDMR